MKPGKIVLFVLVGFVAFLSGGWLLQRRAEAVRTYDRAALFRQVLQHVAEYYVDDVAETELYDMAIDGMLGELHDPYTGFLREQEYGELRLSTTGNYGGLGVRIDLRDGFITVVTPLPDTPAERAGIVAGDRIVRVEGESAVGWSSDQAVAHLKGEPGTRVRIGVERAGYPDLLQFTITRERIHVNSVGSALMVAPGIGYVSLATVAQTSAREVAEAVSDLRAGGARSLVLDLRNNPGGLLDQGVGVVDLFLPPGLEVVETRGRAPGQSQIYRTESQESWEGMPVIVLVNELSASSAEIIAGALQDQDRALVVGRTTFGKGVAQLVFRISENEALRVTTARWYTPLGRSINRSHGGDEGTPRWSPVGVVATLPDSARGDSSEAGGQPTYRTPAGRELSGAGGIVPDVAVPQDTLRDTERAFARGLGPDVPTFRDVITGLALEWKAQGLQLDSNFVVTAAMNAEVRSRLLARGVEIDRVDWDNARTLIDQQLGYEMARYLFDRRVEMARRAADDRDIARAVELLEAASSQPELFRLAAAGIAN